MGENIYDNIDYCLTTLYESIYNLKTDECFRFDTINKKDIIIDNLKKNNDFNYSEVLQGNIEKNDIYNNRVHYKIKNKSYPYTLEIGFHNKKYNINDQKRPELYNMAMMYMCSEIVFEEKFNHFLLPIMCFDIKKDKLEKIIPTLKKDFGKLYETDNENMYIIVTEHYFKMYTLKEYIYDNISTITSDDIKNILFQIYITLAKLNERFNKFRHNKLNLDAIRLYIKLEPSDNIYKIGGNQYKLSNNKVEIKITDFDYSYNSSDYLINNNPYIFLNNLTIENPYYDINYITNLVYLYLELLKDKNENINNIIKELKNLFNEIIPEKYRINKIDKIENFNGMNEEQYIKNNDISITPYSIIKKYLQ
jgi:hypothetical protein